MAQQASKGSRAEEALRHYFRELGYFVVRGIPIKIQEMYVTDIDLWLYHRPSPLMRVRINVDVKDKKSAQALARVFWAKGVQGVLGLDSCIVVTSDKRPEITEFSRRHGITLIDGKFLGNLKQKPVTGYLADEDLASLSASRATSKASPNWFEQARTASARMVTHFGFGACNYLIPEVRFFVERAMIDDSRSDEAIRYSYLLMSYFLASLDFGLWNTAFVTSDERVVMLEEGLRFGPSGKAGTERILDIAARLAAASVPGATLGGIQSALRESAGSYPVQSLAEYFGKNNVSSSLFKLAKDFNRHALVGQITLPSALDAELKACFFVFLDFYGIARKEFVERSERGSKQLSFADKL